MHLLRFLPALAWATLIFWLSAQPQLPPPPVVFAGVDKVLHAAVYAVLTLLTLGGDRWPPLPRAWWWLGVCVLYGLSDEVHQLFVPLRTADGWDLLADGAGAALALALVQRWRLAANTRSEVTT